MSELLIVDRIVQGLVICETGSRDRVVLLLETLPAGVREGDCLRERDGEYQIDHTETEQRRAYNRDLFNSLLEDGD